MTTLVVRAYNYANEKHKAQVRRDSGLPYITHPCNVARLVAQNYEKYKHLLTFSKDTLIAAAFLHDVVEDTDSTLEDVARETNTLVSILVDELTTDNISSINKTEYLTTKMQKMSINSLYIKLCDRTDNLEDFLYGKDIKRAENYARSTLQILSNLTNLTPFSDLVDNIKLICHQILKTDKLEL